MTASQNSTGCSDLARRSYASRGVAFRVLEGRRKGFELGVGHSERTAFGAPASYDVLDAGGDLLGASPRNLEIWSNGEQCFDRRLWAGLGRDPGFELTHAIGERVQVESWGQP